MAFIQLMPVLCWQSTAEISLGQDLTGVALRSEAQTCTYRQSPTVQHKERMFSTLAPISWAPLAFVDCWLGASEASRGQANQDDGSPCFPGSLCSSCCDRKHSRCKRYRERLTASAGSIVTFTCNNHALPYAFLPQPYSASGQSFESRSSATNRIGLHSQTTIFWPHVLELPGWSSQSGKYHLLDALRKSERNCAHTCSMSFTDTLRAPVMYFRL